MLHRIGDTNSATVQSRPAVWLEQTQRDRFGTLAERSQQGPVGTLAERSQTGPVGILAERSQCRAVDGLAERSQRRVAGSWPNEAKSVCVSRAQRSMERERNDARQTRDRSGLRLKR